MDYLNRVISHPSGFGVINSICPRLKSGIKIIATGFLITAPCELLLPVSLLSQDVRSFLTRHWQILRTGKAPEIMVSNRSWTDRMVEKTHTCNNNSNSIVNRWVVSRAMGSVGVAGASLFDTIKELALGILTGIYAFGTGLVSIAFKGRAINPLKLKNATGRDALNHVRDAVIHAVIVVAAPVLGITAPSKLLLPVMLKINFSDSTKSSFLHQIADQTRRISNRQLALIGAGLLGLTAVGYSYGALSAFKAVVLPSVQNAVSFPLTRKIVTAVASNLSMPQGSVVFQKLRLLVGKIDPLYAVAALAGLRYGPVIGAHALEAILERIPVPRASADRDVACRGNRTGCCTVLNTQMPSTPAPLRSIPLPALFVSLGTPVVAENIVPFLTGPEAERLRNSHRAFTLAVRLDQFNWQTLCPDEVATARIEALGGVRARIARERMANGGRWVMERAHFLEQIEKDLCLDSRASSVAWYQLYHLSEAMSEPWVSWVKDRRYCQTFLRDGRVAVAHMGRLRIWNVDGTQLQLETTPLSRWKQLTQSTPQIVTHCIVLPGGNIAMANLSRLNSVAHIWVHQPDGHRISEFSYRHNKRDQLRYMTCLLDRRIVIGHGDGAVDVLHLDGRLSAQLTGKTASPLHRIQVLDDGSLDIFAEDGSKRHWTPPTRSAPQSS